ncbi:MAG TPA: phosphatase PAP2 family protein [Gemmatimonadaceae bacterium]|nr:phosphatase PAP2 family protein [Gemmatimonadaceae bacterium]
MHRTSPGSSFIDRLEARDRALFLRVAISRSPSARRVWSALTHCGGARASLAAAVLPLALGGAVAVAARQALATVAISHILVQLVKRTVGRPRPSAGVLSATLVAEPDRFSFPSGHSAAAMAVACVYAMAFPAMGAPLLLAAMLVGASRVCLGVHYPGDVVMGQVLAVLTAAVVRQI